jgi:hypothetical protein
MIPTVQQQQQQQQQQRYVGLDNHVGSGRCNLSYGENVAACSLEDDIFKDLYSSRGIEDGGTVREERAPSESSPVDVDHFLR